MCRLTSYKGMTMLSTTCVSSFDIRPLSDLSHVQRRSARPSWLLIFVVVSLPTPLYVLVRRLAKKKFTHMAECELFGGRDPRYQMHPLRKEGLQTPEASPVTVWVWPRCLGTSLIVCHDSYSLPIG